MQFSLAEPPASFSTFLDDSSNDETTTHAYSVVMNDKQNPLTMNFQNAHNMMTVSDFILDKTWEQSNFCECGPSSFDDKEARRPRRLDDMASMSSSFSVNANSVAFSSLCDDSGLV